MEKLKEKLNIQNIIILFIIAQPILDIITALSIEYAHASITIGIVIRTIFMAFCVVLGIVKADKKFRIGMLVYYAILFIYMLGFLVNNYMKNGTSLIFLQIKGLVKNFYLPIIIVALIPIFKSYKIKIDKKVLNTSLMMYAITIFVCSIIGFSFLTYKEGDKAGTVGLFYSANEIGAILCILAPFLIVDLSKRKWGIADYLYVFLLIFAVLQVGTKVPYFGLMILMLIIIFACIVNGKIKKDKGLYKKAGMFFCLLIAVYLVTGLTPVGSNLTKIYGNVFIINPKEQDSSLTQFKDFAQLKNASVSGRDELLAVNKEKYINSNIKDKLLGIGFVENKDGDLEELKLTEMDYYDILFCNGVLGTVLFAIPIFAFGILLIYYTKLDRTKIGIEQGFSVIMAAVVALLAGHVITSPAVSIYVAIIVLNYYYDVHLNNEVVKENNEN